jgi:hypothetical protein
MFVIIFYDSEAPIYTTSFKLLFISACPELSVTLSLQVPSNADNVLPLRREEMSCSKQL